MIILVISKYRDGEVKSIEGYTTDEKEANKKVKELNNAVGEGESYSYVTEFIDKIQ